MGVSTCADTVAGELRASLGLEHVSLLCGLSQDELFSAAVEGDLGRVRPGGPDDDHKAHATALGTDGPLVFYSDPSCTGRPVDDTYCVGHPSVADDIWWKPDFARFGPQRFNELVERVVAHLNGRRARLYVTDRFCGTDPDFAEPCRFVVEYASHAYFCNIMFPAGAGVGDSRRSQMRSTNSEAEQAYAGAGVGDSRRSQAVDAAMRALEGVAGAGVGDSRRSQGWTLLNVPSFRCDPARDGTRSERAVIVDMERRLALVLGRADYCGVNKKTMFTIMNFVLPAKGQLSMHCSANIGAGGDGAILFGLSGTGKTTLSADPARMLIGDDEHIWTNTGIANFEAGCYAKLIDLDKTVEPVIAAALSMKGTLIENVPPPGGLGPAGRGHGRDLGLGDTHPQELDLTDRSITENTRIAYPLECNPNVAPDARGPHPGTIVLLTADAFGVLPPVSLLDPDEVMYHFVTGFTSKLAGTEVGVTEPEATFSSCFGAPFMARRAHVYARLLEQRMRQHRVRCVMLNTGWSGGAYGTGARMPLGVTRTLLNAALDGRFDGAPTKTHPILGLSMPVTCDGIDDTILDPRRTWQDPGAYDAAATRLRDMFRSNYDTQGYADLGIAAAM